MKQHDYTFSISPHFSCLNKIKTDQSDYIFGYVMTEFGTIGVYAQGCAKRTPTCEFTICLGKTVHVRKFNKLFTGRGLVRKAKEFARELGGKG